jgi:hypothetical protein
VLVIGGCLWTWAGAGAGVAGDVPRLDARLSEVAAVCLDEKGGNLAHVLAEGMGWAAKLKPELLLLSPAFLHRLHVKPEGLGSSVDCRVEVRGKAQGALDAFADVGFGVHGGGLD